jgi:UDP-N-acetylglucosamine--N-acetylmuramyl-(pentapeptide) pyrophosphoryl-undecaprenol N-acetylglucosamine transferase
MNIAVVAGGTGGHIFPAIATIEELKKNSSIEKIDWITTSRGNESELALKYQINMVQLAVTGIQRKISIQPLIAVAKSGVAFLKMVAFLKKERIGAVIAFGGYVCGPVLMAAKLLKIKIYLHEQNSIPGMVNKMFASKSEKMFLGMPLAEGNKVDAKTEVVGTPVRDKSGDESNFNFPETIQKDIKTVLICGGSQGAVSMNRVLVDSVEKLTEMGYQVIWQTGKPGYEEMSLKFKDNSLVTLFDSVENLYPYYKLATLLIGRSGASTISEAVLFNLPSILIPLPWSSENHQHFNAGFAEQSGYSIRVEQNLESSVKVLEVSIKLLEDDNKEYQEMVVATQNSELELAAKKVATEVGRA